MAEQKLGAGKGAVHWWRDERKRGLVAQALVVLAAASVVFYLVQNMLVNLARLGVPISFGFLGNVAGFPVSMSLIPLDLDSTNASVLVAGILNTVFASVIIVVVATILGFIIGIMRLSTNFLIARIAAAYIEILRNIPLLVQLLFWYFGVLQLLPRANASLVYFDAVALNVRGLFMPRPIFDAGAVWIAVALGVAALVAIFVFRWAHRRQILTGKQFPTTTTAILLLLVLPTLAGLLAGSPVHWEMPKFEGFNFNGGIAIVPELIALVLGLGIYTSAFIAEIVRGGILAVSHGQTEAAHALGLPAKLTLRLVIIPQALRVIIPPLTSQYLNILKNSTLAVAVGYPDFVSLFTGTVLNQTGRAVEIVGMTMAFYLTISLAISLLMNIYNRRAALAER